MMMHIEIDRDAVEESKKDWDIKWQKYRTDIAEESLNHIDGMGPMELRERSNWLQTEFNRIRENLPGLSNDTVPIFFLFLTAQHNSLAQSDPQILGGLMLVGELLDKCQADLVTLSTAAKADVNQPITNSAVLKFGIPIEQLKMIERSHMFILSCTNKITTRKQAQAVKSRHQISGVSRQSESEIQSSRASRSSQDISSEPEHTQAPGTEVSAMEIHPHTLVENGNDTHGASTNLGFQSGDIGHGRLLGPRINQTPQNPLTVSSSSSHLKNLTALLGIAFFGASITWSTIFSGTRGDLALISWSACLFIVGAVGAGSASMLVLPEEDIVAKHLEVRWTVRILSLLAMAHVLAGMFLVALAILVLDPAQESPRARAGRAGMQSAGGYAIAVSAVFVGVCGLVWRRYTIQTWFR
ncbi:hypothetical protein B0H19DRAFT_1383842 [Mycena capillaripes]|nr:hypothetical protein B0H19DRAFT_1383842 [Mycena capillaripes]